MSVHETHCPKCETTLRSKAGIPVGQTVSCPKCKHKFVVRESEEPDVVEDEDDIEERAPTRRKGPPASARRSVARDDEDAEEERPRKKKSGSARKSRDRDDEDDEEDRPRKKKRLRRDDGEPENLYWRLRHNVAVRVITLVVLLGILAVLAYMLYEQRKDRERLENGSLAAPAFAFAPAGPESASTRTVK
ncbi:MAG TPA: hypothetical protein VKD90_08465 [Gemmataceae bacterium]|nr:hypothetical protein [Gemmataceae bacterium]